MKIRIREFKPAPNFWADETDDSLYALPVSYCVEVYLGVRRDGQVWRLPFYKRGSAVSYSGDLCPLSAKGWYCAGDFPFKHKAEEQVAKIDALCR
jgi:hypothetical protein